MTPNTPSVPLMSHQTKSVQEIVGTLLYYTRVVDSTLACEFYSIATKIHDETQAVVEACHQILDYVATHLNVTIQYIASDMILLVHSNMSYLSEQNSKSQVGGHYYLSSTDDNKPANGTILNLLAIIKNFVSSATEAKLASLVYNCKNSVLSWRNSPIINTQQPLS